MRDAAEAALEGWAENVAATRDQFINGLVHAGFRLIEDQSAGATSNATLRNQRITVTLVDGFPYVAPKVKPNVPVRRSWHGDRGGYLCLYTPHEPIGQPWLDPQTFLTRVDEWFEKNEAGWPGDPPALELEAYLGLPVDPRFVVHDGLPGQTSGYVQMRANKHQIEYVGAGHVPKKSRKGRLSGFVTDLGQLTEPPADWTELLALLPDAAQIRTAISRSRLDIVLMRYRRGLHQGVLAVTLRRLRPGGPLRPHLILSAATGEAALRVRSGPAAHQLADKHVYLVGVGALGSHIADYLSRAGIGQLTLRDPDIFTPGNATRHLVTTSTVAGASKAHAVAALLEARPYNRARITPVTTGLVSPYEAAALLQGEALVVDAAADDAVTCMLEDAAAHLGARFITACVQNEGRTLRVDLVPPLDGREPQPPTTTQPGRAPEVFESGCASPVSVTPPHAIAEAAAIATRHIIGRLTGAPANPAGEIREFT